MLEVIRHIFQPDVILPLAIFSIPLAAIIGNYYLKVQKLKLGGNLSREDVLLLKKTIEENQDLRKRVENLEDIITSLDTNLLDNHQNFKQVTTN